VLIARGPDYPRLLEPQLPGHALLLCDQRHAASAILVHRNDHGDARIGGGEFSIVTLGFSEKIGVGDLTVIDQGRAVIGRNLAATSSRQNGLRVMR
jgi:hypothetical protein